MFPAGYTQKNTRPKRSVSSRTISDYSPFGVLLPERSVSTGDFRYGYNGKEKVDEIKGEGNSYDFGARMYDPRVGRWLSIDPLFTKYPSLSPYNYTGNNPVNNIDPDGKKIRPTNEPATQIIDLMLKPFERIFILEVSDNGTIYTNTKFESFAQYKTAFKAENKAAVKRGDAKLPASMMKEGWNLYLAVSDPKTIEFQATTTGGGAAPKFGASSQKQGSLVVEGTPQTENHEQSELYAILKQYGMVNKTVADGLYEGKDIPYEHEKTDGSTETIQVQITPDIRVSGLDGYVFFKDEKFVQTEKGQIFIDITNKSVDKIKQIVSNALENVTTPE